MSAPHPLSAALKAGDVAILGKKNAGKTYAAKGAAEHLLDAQARLCIIDPAGAYSGLRTAANGTDAGYPVAIVGGRHGDIELVDTMARPLARIVGTRNTPLIIDTSKMTAAARTRFAADFGEELFIANEGPLHLFADEAHVLMPQTRELRDREVGRMLHAWNQIVAMGRGQGLRVTLISQRPAKVHKDSLTQVETMAALRMIAPQDCEAVEAWLKRWAGKAQSDKILASLPSLPTGEGWIYSPEQGRLERVRFPPIRTFDSSKTPDGAPAKPVKLQAIDFAELREALADAQAAEAAPAGKAKPAPDIEALGRQHAAEIASARRDAHNAAVASAVAAVQALFDVPDSAPVALSAAFSGSRSVPRVVVDSTTRPRIDPRSPMVRAHPARTQTAVPAPAPLEEPATQGGERILRVLDHSPPVPLTWEQIAVLVCMAPNGPWFRKARRDLLDSRQVRVDDDGVTIARRSADAARFVADRAALIARWQSRVSKLAPMAPAILAELGANGPRCTIGTLARAAGADAKGPWFRRALKTLRNHGLITQAGEVVELHPLLYWGVGGAKEDGQAAQY